LGVGRSAAVAAASSANGPGISLYEDLGDAETAELMDCSIGTVKSQTADGLRELRTTFDMRIKKKAAHDRVRS
jgi:hypothetical protein